MLEGSVWRQYNEQNSFREMLSQFCALDSLDLMEDDKALYAAMKSKPTKKELKLFAMDSAKMSDEEMCAASGVDADELVQSKYKLYKKLKQDKVRLSFRKSEFHEEYAI